MLWSACLYPYAAGDGDGVGVDDGVGVAACGFVGFAVGLLLDCTGWGTVVTGAGGTTTGAGCAAVAGGGVVWCFGGLHDAERHCPGRCKRLRTLRAGERLRTQRELPGSQAQTLRAGDEMQERVDRR